MTGICHEGTPERPQLLPAAANDYTTGYLGAYGDLAGTGATGARRRQLSRAGVAVSVRHVHLPSGRVGYQPPGMDLSEAELDELLVESQPASGKVRHLGPVLRMSETQPFWDKPTPVLGADKPEWLDASGARA